MDITEDIRNATRLFKGKGDDELRAIVHRKAFGTPDHIAAATILEERRFERIQAQHAAQQESLNALRDRLDTISGQISRSEWRTWTLWFALGAVIIAAFALVRDAFDWRVPSPPSVAPVPESSVPHADESKDSKPQPEETPTPPRKPDPQPRKSTAQQGVGHRCDPAVLS